MSEPQEESPERPWRLIAGLGNPGERYRATRHNVGFWVVAELARRWQVSLAGEECGARTAELASRRALLVQPQTFMNRSGFALRCLAECRGIDPQSMLVVYDELHLPLGRLRLRPRGSPGGHRGLESVVENLRTEEVARLRCGIAPLDDPAPDGQVLVDFVLSPFEEDEQGAVDEMVSRAADACEAWLAEGIAVAMNRFNG